MAILLSGQNLTKAFHGRPLFEGLNVALGDGERLGILGPNGAGKTTLLRILAGLDECDSGTISLKQGLRRALVVQAPIYPPHQTVRAVVEMSLRSRWGSGLDEVETAFRSERTLSQMGFGGAEAPLDAPVGALSGGWIKRLALAEALVLEPDLLFLDEPTNHLDLDGIYWLEELLAQASFAWAMISHDRLFLERTATRFLEINRMYPRGLFECVGRYSQFVERRAETLKSQESEAAALANKVRREVEWLRRGPQARATKAKGRIDEAHSLIAELGRVKERVGAAAREGASIDFSATTRKTRRLIVAEDLEVRVGDRTLLSKVDLVLTPGLRLGLMGGNGCGKTSLLKVLAGMVPPTSGSLTQANQLKLVYFDQNRERLDGSLTLRRTLCPSGDAVIFRGQSIHVAGWARRFAFSASQLDVPVGELSGGEQARTLIARLMLEDADVLLLDEPTNDLDLETLEALEDALRDFPGALVLVSHDRYLVDSVCNVIAALDGQGGLQLFADLAQWEAESRRKKSKPSGSTPLSPTISPTLSPTEGSGSTSGSPERGSKGTKRLSYMEQREFDRIEGDIAEAEARVAFLEAAIQDPVMGADAGKLAEAYGELTEAQSNVERLYARWAELEAKLT